MFEDEFEERESKKNTIRIIVAAICFVVALAVAVVLIFTTFGRKGTGDSSQGAEKSVDAQPSVDENAGNRGAGDNPGSSESQTGTGSPGSSEGQTGTGSPGSSESQTGTGHGTEYGMKFREVNETVTAKDVTNLRNIPSQGAESTVLLQLSNGETAIRTGISDSGWSRLVLDGTTYYAVSNYLTTDLAYQPKKPEDDGIRTRFSDCREQVTPKIEINLRSIPSVTNPDSVVVATAYAGEVFVRTGINTELGWSRVEYNGQVLYCVSSYLNAAE